MPLDQFGNYICDIWPVAVSPLPASMGGGSSGSGAPSNSDGQDGDTYVNTLDGQIWTKTSGVWAIHPGTPGPAGGSGTYGTFSNPNGNVTADRGTSYYNTSTGAVWFKNSGDGTNTGWSPVIQ